MAIALSRFQALCGFRPFEEIKNFLEEVRELRQVIGEELCAKFTNVQASQEDLVKQALDFYYYYYYYYYYYN